MTELRAKPGNLSLVGPAPHGSLQVYHDRHPVETMLAPGFFLPVLSNLRIGDTLELQSVARAQDGSDYIREMLSTIVVAAGRGGVALGKKGEVRHFDDISEPCEELTQPLKSNYVPTDCVAAHKHGGTYEIKRVDTGEILATIKGKARAQAIANGQEPLPQAA